MLRSNTLLELCEPLPFAVATWMLMSLTTGTCPARPADSRNPTSVVAIYWKILPAMTNDILRELLSSESPGFLDVTVQNGDAYKPFPNGISRGELLFA